MPIWLSEAQYRNLDAACERLIPAADGFAGARVAGVADYIDTLLGAFTFDPPRIFAGGPTSGRHGGEARFGEFLRLGPLEELAWRIRIEGSAGMPEREFNGPHVGLQERYRAGLAELGDDFAERPPEEQDRRLRAHEEFTELLYGHACEGMYGAPEYGGNRDGVGWRDIGAAGDVQPGGWTDEEVSRP